MPRLVGLFEHFHYRLRHTDVSFPFLDGFPVKGRKHILRCRIILRNFPDGVLDKRTGFCAVNRHFLQLLRNRVEPYGQGSVAAFYFWASQCVWAETEMLGFYTVPKQCMRNLDGEKSIGIGDSADIASRDCYCRSGKFLFMCRIFHNSGNDRKTVLRQCYCQSCVYPAEKEYNNIIRIDLRMLII